MHRFVQAALGCQVLLGAMVSPLWACTSFGLDTPDGPFVGAPLLMLDGNTELAGNIDHFFGPYDYDANLKSSGYFAISGGSRSPRMASLR